MDHPERLTNQRGELPRVLGVDPGLATTGYGILEVVAARQPRVCEAGVLRSKHKATLAQRLLELHRSLTEVIEEWRPVAMALEQLFSHYQRPRTAILMGHARGVICLAAAEAGIPVTGYSATEVKKSLTGNGQAKKPQMQAAVRRELLLDRLPEPHDVGDALAIALCHVYRQKNWAVAVRRA